MAYDNDSMIRVGESVLPIKNVPPLWFIHWYRGHKGNNYTGHKRKLLQWIEANYDNIKNRLPQKEKVSAIVEPVKKKERVPCFKKAYINKKVANEVLKKVREIFTKGKRPIRSYECPYCGMWHLTSRTLINKNNKS